MGQSAAEWFGGADLATKYAIVLGTLFAVVIVLGLVKLCFDRRRLRKHATKLAQEAKIDGAAPERETSVPKDLEEGDLFGVRAIESGFFGGVAQSRPGSAISSRAPSLSGRPVSPAASISGGGGIRSTPSPAPYRGTPPIAPSGSLPLRNGESRPSSPSSGSAPPLARIQSKPKPLVLRASTSNLSLNTPSPLGQNPVSANEMFGTRSSAEFSRDHLLPSPAHTKFSARPSAANDLHPSASEPTSPANITPTSKNGGARAEAFVGHAPQLDLPRAFSPAFRTDFEETPGSSKTKGAQRPTQEHSGEASQQASKTWDLSNDKERVMSFSRPMPSKDPALGNDVDRRDGVPPALPAAHSDVDGQAPFTSAVADWGKVFNHNEQSLDNKRARALEKTPAAPPSTSSLTSNPDASNPFADSDARSSRNSSITSTDSVQPTPHPRVQRLSRPAASAVRVSTGSIMDEDAAAASMQAPGSGSPWDGAIELAALNGNTFPRPPKAAESPYVRPSQLPRAAPGAASQRYPPPASQAPKAALPKLPDEAREKSLGV